MIRTSELRGFEGDVSPSRGSYKGLASFVGIGEAA